MKEEKYVDYFVLGHNPVVNGSRDYWSRVFGNFESLHINIKHLGRDFFQLDLKITGMTDSPHFLEASVAGKCGETLHLSQNKMLKFLSFHKEGTFAENYPANLKLKFFKYVE